MPNDWQMPRAGHACASCARSFNPDETFRASLYETPAGYERRDFCLTCTPPSQPPAVGTWKARRAAPAAKPTRTFDRQAMYQLFVQLADSSDSSEPPDSSAHPAAEPTDSSGGQDPGVNTGAGVARTDQTQLRFVLALLLWRKRVLKFTGAVESDQGEGWEFVAPAAGETHRVRRPPLAEDQLEHLSNQLEQLLSGESGDADPSTPALTKEPTHGS